MTTAAGGGEGGVSPLVVSPPPAERARGTQQHKAPVDVPFAAGGLPDLC